MPQKKARAGNRLIESVYPREGILTRHLVSTRTPTPSGVSGNRGTPRFAPVRRAEDTSQGLCLSEASHSSDLTRGVPDHAERVKFADALRR